MLALDEFIVGSLADAIPLALVLPRSAYECTALVGGTADAPLTVCLDGRAPYSVIQRNEAYNFSGIIIPGVRIEVDPKQVYAPHDKKIGGLVREGTTLDIVCTSVRGFGLSTVRLVQGLPEISHSESVTFLGWQVVLGNGPAKRVLWSVSGGS